MYIHRLVYLSILGYMNKSAVMSNICADNPFLRCMFVVIKQVKQLLTDSQAVQAFHMLLKHTSRGQLVKDNTSVLYTCRDE